jgi:hypothetical protein
MWRENGGGENRHQARSSYGWNGAWCVVFSLSLNMRENSGCSPHAAAAAQLSYVFSRRGVMPQSTWRTESRGDAARQAAHGV